MSLGITRSPELNEVEDTENEVEDETSSGIGSGTDKVLHQTANLPSDQLVFVIVDMFRNLQN